MDDPFERPFPDRDPGAPVAPGDDDPLDAERSPFDHAPLLRPRRNWGRIWTIAAIAFAVLALAGILAINRWGLPGWLPGDRPLFGAGQTDLVLEFAPDRQERRTLPNGTEYFDISGSVTNIGQTSRSLPPVFIVLRDARERIVYEWEIAPPQDTLAPGERVEINEAATDVPPSAKFAEIGWKPR